jgi:hypothetical protein
MINSRSYMITGLLLVSMAASAQRKSRLPDVSSTFKGTLVLPAPVNNPLFNDVTETLGQVDGVLQFPLWNGLGLGAGAKQTWFGVKERALAPEVTSGDIRKTTFFGKLQYERFTGERTFYELSIRAGSSTYVFDCPTCSDESTRTVFHWSVGTGYYVHVSDNLAFGFTLGYERDNTRFKTTDLGLESFPGRTQTEENTEFQNIMIGLGFSTRLRKSEQAKAGW